MVYHFILGHFNVLQNFAIASSKEAALYSTIAAIVDTIKKAIILNPSTFIANGALPSGLDGEAAANIIASILSSHLRASSSLHYDSIKSSFVKISSIVEESYNIPVNVSKTSEMNLLVAAQAGAEASKKVGPEVTASIKQIKLGELFTFENFFSSSLGISIIVIVCIVIILLIIYLILKYNSKRKIKKKLNYIKLLN